jgi:hypothetical protein
MVEHFRDGGWGMFQVLIFGLILLGAAIKYAVTPEKRLVPLLMGLGILTMASGGLGFVTGLITTAGAIANNPDFHDRPGLITIVGFGESLNNLAFALIFVTLASVAACIGATQIARTKNNEPESA